MKLVATDASIPATASVPLQKPLLINTEDSSNVITTSRTVSHLPKQTKYSILAITATTHVIAVTKNDIALATQCHQHRRVIVSLEIHHRNGTYILLRIRYQARRH